MAPEAGGYIIQTEYIWKMLTSENQTIKILVICPNSLL